MDQKNLYLWLIPLLPLAGAAINGLFGRRFSKNAVTAVALASTAATFGMALYIASQFSGLARLPHIEKLPFQWINIYGFSVDFGFYLDQLSLVMLLVVTGVGFLIHIYSVGYMAHEGGYYRFFAYMNLFMFFMLTLILADNYLLMFVGWEGVGLASYLLIGFYFLKNSASQAGKKAFIVNRIGDFAFLVGMFLMVKTFGSLDFSTVFNAILENPARFPVESAGIGVLTLIAFGLMIGATGKSAQLPLYVWLPDAMEGPTPVSALIHAATMVTAGIYMVARSNAIFTNATHALHAVAIIGALTAIMAASIGIAQNDIKRVLAYSTISQLGYMFMACGVAAYSAAIFHLMTHAFFKALLFLSAGSVIHALSGEQDMRNMGGLRKLIPWTFGVMAVATIAISGIPPFAGFFSKDEILWKAFSSAHGHWIFWLIGVITALMTSFYMFRLLFMTFWGERRNAAPTHGHDHSDGHGHGVHESPWVMLAPLVLLATLSIVGGLAGVPHALGGGNHFEKFLEPVFKAQPAPTTALSVPAEHAPLGAVARGESPAASVAESASAETAAITTEHVHAAEATEGHGATGEHSDTGTELMLTGVSVLSGLLGLLVAYFLYVKRPELPGRIAENMGGLYRAVLNKYYVDEAYQAAVVDPIVDGSTKYLWRNVDQGIIDGTVNGTGTAARLLSGTLRKMQSGNIRSYAAWVAAGAALITAYVIWGGKIWMGTR